jgi:hypothetical protein
MSIVLMQQVPNALIFDGSSSSNVPEKRAKASVAASQADSAVITAVTGKKLRVTSMILSCGSPATTVTFNTKPSGSGTAITNAIHLPSNGSVVMPYNPAGWCETSAAEGLTVTTGAGSTTTYQIGYVEIG